MALLFCDNFENWSSANSNYPGPWQMADNLSNLAGSANVNFSTPNVFQTLNTSSTGYLQLGIAATSTLVVNIRASFGVTGSGTGNKPLVHLIDGTTIQCSLVMKSNGKFAIFRGTNTAELAESINTYPFNSDEFLDIEWKVTVHNTTGVIELRVNGVTEITSTGSLNTRAGTNNSADTVRLGTSTTGLARPFYKHFILMDTTGSVMNDFIGPVDVTSLRPNADGEYDDWTANTGTRFAAVNQAVTDNDTTFVSSSTPGDQVTFQLGNLPSGVTDVFAVFPQMQIRREQGTTRICKFLMRSGIDDELGTKELAVGPTYAFRQEAITTSPFTTNAWDVAEVNGLELGVEITT